jgi:CheY-like chemotaxis protein
LVAEDNDNNYLLFKSILQNDYQLLHAHDGVEAVELFNANQPDLILMDINMPRMDGNEATREIRKVSETVPIVAVTAYAFASDKERIMENGFNEYVSKPINVKRLREVVKAMLERRR